jgi:glycosyltransferase involved in cell wall biosynthesis
VPQGDVGALRDAILALLSDPGRGARLGREGRAFVEGQYGWAAVWARYEALLEDMA